MSKYQALRKRLDKIEPKEHPGHVRYVAVWGNPEIDKQIRQALGEPHFDYKNLETIASWGDHHT